MARFTPEQQAVIDERKAYWASPAGQAEEKAIVAFNEDRLKKEFMLELKARRRARALKGYVPIRPEDFN